MESKYNPAEIINLYKKYQTKIPANFVFKDPLLEKKPRIEQTAGNCWLYGNLNVLYFDTAIDQDGVDMEKYVELWGINSQKGNNPIVSETLICEKFSEKKLGIYELDLVLPQYRGRKGLEDKHLYKVAIKRFGQLLVQGVCFGYSRIMNDLLRQDIKDNDSIDKALSFGNDDGRHREMVRFDKKNKQIKTLGQYSKTNIFTEFKRSSTDFLIQSIKAGTVNSRFSFIYYK